MLLRQTKIIATLGPATPRGKKVLPERKFLVPGAKFVFLSDGREQGHPPQRQDITNMMTQPHAPRTKADDAARVHLAADANYADLARLLNDCAQRECYRVCVEANAVRHLGTVEFRVLGSFADEFQRHGGFLKLENANANVAARVCEFGRSELLRATPV